MKFNDEYKIIYYATKYMKPLTMLVLKFATDADLSALESERLTDFLANYPGGTSI